ncbi:mitochondrial carrier homolog 2-like [Fopius arisanus]|uniref:Mitochondrial carrier homolog 2-like n=1 Tax=Fopius arisanus TaxID=64838 RepID=A0A9R1TSX0_9HYME|nr:PREDICTED: mitochondrial carrier homolog 2-like [Fopius arisanus]
MSLSTMGRDKEVAMWSTVAIRMLVNTISHPLEYAKVLIQIGHEPSEPIETRTLFGKPALALPNIFQYVRYIKSVDGFAGCYRGLVPNLCANAVNTIAIGKAMESKYFIKYFPETQARKDEDIDDLPDDKRREIYLRELAKGIACRIIGIVASHPLDVITLRTMAQFVGGENKYNGIFGSIREVYHENGLLGYYAGLVPRLIANVTTLVLVSASTYFVNKYLIKDKDLRDCTTATMTFLATTVTYPFLVVYHCMAVNDCGLPAGVPPRMPIYGNWLDCWRHLSSINQSKRGSSLLWRYYTGPQTIINGHPVALTKTTFYK